VTWLVALVIAVIVVVLVAREVVRWRGGRWFGGMRSGSRPDED